MVYSKAERIKQEQHQSFDHALYPPCYLRFQVSCTPPLTMPDHKQREATMPTPSRSNLAQILLDLRGVEGVGLCSLQQSDIQLCLESYRQVRQLVVYIAIFSTYDYLTIQIVVFPYLNLGEQPKY